MARGKVRIKMRAIGNRPVSDQMLGDEHPRTTPSKSFDKVGGHREYVDGHRHYGIESTSLRIGERSVYSPQWTKAGLRAVRDPAQLIRCASAQDEVIDLRRQRGAHMVEQADPANPRQGLVAPKTARRPPGDDGSETRPPDASHGQWHPSA